MADDLEFIHALFKAAGVPLDGDDVWEVQKARVVKHKALERLAAAVNIKFDAPVILRNEADEAVLLVSATGSDGKHTEWSIGEAKIVPMVDTGRKNNWGKPVYEPADGAIGNYQITPKQGAYPFAMAEKRAKDRVILKMVGLHGVYSEDEADDFQQRQREPEPREEVGGERAGYVALAKGIIQNFGTAAELGDWWRNEHNQRTRLRIVKGDPDYETLYTAVLDRGAALAPKDETK